MATDSVLSNYLANLILNRYVTNDAVFIAVHTADPGPTGDRSTEASGPSYERSRLSFGSPAARTVTVDEVASLSQLPAGDYWGFGFWDAISLGNLLWRAPFVGPDGVTPIRLSSSVISALPITIGDVALSL